MAWFKRLAAPKVKSEQKASVPSGIGRLCDGCGVSALAEDVDQAFETCPSCGLHFRIGARERLVGFLDEDSAIQEAVEPVAGDPRAFVDAQPYSARVEKAQGAVDEKDAFVPASGTLEGRPVVAGAFEFRFAGPRVIEQTIHHKLPEGFQRAEFLLEHGVIDPIVPRKELRSRVAKIVEFLVGSAEAA